MKILSVQHKEVKKLVVIYKKAKRRRIMKKFLSRKFIAMVAGVLTGLGVLLTGQTVEGLTAVIASIIGYLAAEGYIDASRISVTDETLE